MWLFRKPVSYLETFHDGVSNGKATTDLISALEKLNNKNEDVQEILRGKDSLSKKSQWIFGGDGWLMISVLVV